MFSPEQKADLVERCKAGEGLRDIVQSLGVDPDQGMRWLQQNYRTEMRAAKQEQVARRA